MGRPPWPQSASRGYGARRIRVASGDGRVTPGPEPKHEGAVNVTYARHRRRAGCRNADHTTRLSCETAPERSEQPRFSYKTPATGWPRCASHRRASDADSVSPGGRPPVRLPAPPVCGRHLAPSQTGPAPGLVRAATPRVEGKRRTRLSLAL